MTWRLLFVDDVAEDVELAMFALADWAQAWTSQRVDSEAKLIEALAGFRPDVVLSDFYLPGFGGEDAFVCVQAHSPATSFVFLTGASPDSLSHVSVPVWDKNRLEVLPYLLETLLGPAKEAVVASWDVTAGDAQTL